MDELTKAFPNVWCPNCGKVQPMEFANMKANDRDYADPPRTLALAARAPPAAMRPPRRLGTEIIASQKRLLQGAARPHPRRPACS
jgi:hypothetical protein